MSSTTPVQMDSVGIVSEWAGHFLRALQSENFAELSYAQEIDSYLSKPISQRAPIVLVENHPDSQKWIRSIRKSSVRHFIIWFGKNFSKEDLVFALANRVYAVFEDIGLDDERVTQSLNKLTGLVRDEKQFDLLFRSLKTTLIGLEGDLAKAQLDEIKTAVNKLESLGLRNEFAFGSDEPSDEAQDNLVVQPATQLGDALSTIDSVERTGVLWVRGKDKAQEGRVDFMYGRIISATAGETIAKKAIYRMFLWEAPKLMFTRRAPEECVIGESVNTPVSGIATEGESQRRRYKRIQKDVPPLDLKLELDPKSLKLDTSLNSDDFSVLSSVVEFGRIETILDYNELPDATIYESLINLRRANLVRIV